MGREAAHAVLITGSYVLLAVSGLVFLAGETWHLTRKSRDASRADRHASPKEQAGAVPTPDRPVAPVDDLVDLLDNTLKLASAVPAGHLEPVDVTDLLSTLADRHKSARLSVNVRPRPVHTLASRPAFTRALEILLETALFDGARASVSCDRGMSALVVHVDNDGPGVPHSERAHIFEWNYYMTTPPSAYKGWRVELVIARRILQAHGGDISVGPSPLGGARYTARMPLLSEHEMELAVAS